MTTTPLRIHWLSLVLLLLVLLFVCCEIFDSEDDDTPPEDVQPVGLNFSPYTGNQYPNLGAQVDQAQLRARMAIIAPRTKWIRTFGSTQGLEHAGRLADSLGLKAAIGAWLGRNANANELEIDNLIQAANAGYVDIAIVGSEVLLRGDLSEQQLTGYIGRVRDAIPDSVPVTTAGICSNLFAHPDVLAAVDVVFFLISMPIGKE